MNTAPSSFRWSRLAALVATVLVAIAILGAVGLLREPFQSFLHAFVGSRLPWAVAPMRGEELASAIPAQTVDRSVAKVMRPPSEGPSSTPSPSAVTALAAADSRLPARTGTPVQVTPRAGPEGEFNAYVAFVVANLRAGPGNGYPNLRSYSEGTGLLIVSRNVAGNWLKVETPDGQRGWMNVLLLEVHRSVAEIPVDTGLSDGRPVEGPAPSSTPQPVQALEPTGTALPSRNSIPATATAAPPAPSGVNSPSAAGEAVTPPAGLPDSSGSGAPPARPAIFLLSPTDGLLLAGGRQQFVWQSAGSLANDEYFVLDIWPYESVPRPAATTRENSWSAALDLSPGIYSWRVRRVGQAGGDVVERAVSETYTFTWRP